MKLLHSLRSRTRVKSPPSTPGALVYDTLTPSPPRVSSRPAPALPRNVLERIFLHVCPHTQDESYTTCEDSMVADGCMLCQMRDLARCAYICREWSAVAQQLLYHSVRIDAVHFCDREDSMATKKKHRGHDPQDVAALRLRLFNKTVRENGYLGDLVEFLKMPYMLRESCKADLARTVSMLPNLHYVDLPEGVFSDETASVMLKQELESRCMELRKMRYTEGAEQTFATLPHRRMWHNLEVLEIQGLQIDAETCLLVLASFPTIRELKLGGEMMMLNDELLMPTSSMQQFPPLERLILEKAPGITAKGLSAYLSRPETREVLTFLKVSDTGVTIPELHQVLAAGTSLVDFSISETVSRPFPLTAVAPLAAPQLENLFFGILPNHASANPPVSESYYNYLATSLLSGSFPHLSSLYAYSERLPDALLPLPDLPFAPGGSGLRLNTELTGPKAFANGGPASGPFSAPGGAAPTFTSPFAPPNATNLAAAPLASHVSTHSIASSQSSGSSRPPNGLGRHAPPALNLPGLAHALDLFTKSPAAPEIEWSLTTLQPPSKRNGRRGSASKTRPLSLVMLEQGSGGAAMVPPLAAWRERSRSPAGGSIGGNSAGSSLLGGLPGGGPIRRQSETAMPARTLGGSGFGGFLSVPGAEAHREAAMGNARPGSKSKGGDWMG